MPAEFGFDRCRDLALIQGIECIFECRVIYARSGESKVTTLARRTWILRGFLGDRSEVVTVLHPGSNFIDLGFGFVVAQLTAGLDEDMRSATLLGQIGDLLLIKLLQLLVRHFDLIEE